MNKPDDPDQLERLLPLKVGDRVIAGAGMLAELRCTYTPGTQAVVRWIHVDPDTGQEWGYHYSLVPWWTVKPA